jgi:hypothetical protein
MSDANSSDDLDGDVLGEEIGDDGIPGIGDYPPDHAQGVDDPNLVAEDDVATREARRRGEEPPHDDRRIGDLLPPDGDDGLTDREQQQIASEGESDHTDRAAPAAEIAALHEEREP